METRLEIRLSVQEKAEWKRAAGGKKLAEWLRGLANDACKSDRMESDRDQGDPQSVDHEPDPTAVLAKATPPKPVLSSKGVCSKHMRCNGGRAKYGCPDCKVT